MGTSRALWLSLALMLAACDGDKDTDSDSAADTDAGGDTDSDSSGPGPDTDNGDTDEPVDVDALLADPDGDGLTNGEEERLGTNPDVADTDGGGADDGLEVASGTNPLDANDDATILDTDGDGLTDADEAVLGTDANDPDSDDDLLLDGDEQLEGTNPNDPDSDDGGALDGDEVRLGTDPLDAADDLAVLDTDADGLTDALELALGTDLADPDTDGDSLVDGDEVYFHLTDPRLVDSDADGLGDGDELNLHSTDPTEADTDGGGTSDGFEIQYGLDPNLSTDDGLIVFGDMFETGGLDSAVWLSQNADVEYVTEPVGAGLFALRVGSDGEGITQPFDTTGCSNLLWLFDYKRGPDTPELNDDLTIEYWDGAAWVEAGVLPGGSDDPAFRPRSGLLSDAGAFNTDFALRFTAVGAPGLFDHHHIDDLVVFCDPDLTDDDSDGVINLVDCDPTNDAHWSDCGLCVDADTDDYGELCDLGADCDDGDANINPDGIEIDDDGIDQNCDGFDTATVLFDDFDDGVEDPAVWASLTGAAVTDLFASSGTYSLQLSQGQSAITNTLDTTTCTTVGWTARVKRGPVVPEGNDALEFLWDNGSGTFTFSGEIAGNNQVDPDFQLVFGTIDDPAALSATFSMNLVVTGVGTDDFYLDDFGVGCTIDADADGFPSIVDCDDNDDAHWFDCGLCVDADGDDYGELCDLGDDCDDADDTVFPGAEDAFGDDVDSDCDGEDGPVFSDNFDASTFLDTTRWPTSVDVDPSGAAGTVSGPFALLMDAEGSVTSAQIDTTTCPEIAYSYFLRRNAAVAADESLDIAFDVGGVSTIVDSVNGNGFVDEEYGFQFGTITDASALATDFAFQITLNSLGVTDQVAIDDVRVECTDPDGDGDGVPAALDCDDADAAHWFDCGVCTDGDSDDYGDGCDLGSDCNDADATINPGADDVAGDTTDSDCSVIDGPGIFDDFAGAAASAALTVEGDASISQINAFSGADSLLMGGAGGSVDFVVLPLDGCPALAWEFQVLQGATESPDPGDYLALQFRRNDLWEPLQVEDGQGVLETEFSRVAGTTNDADVLVDNLALRLVTSGDGLGFDDFLVDDIAIGCDDDEDGLSSAIERELYGTDPGVADTDLDTVNDGDEIANGTDPLDINDF